MKKLKITGRPLLIDPNTQKIYTVAQLRAMNCCLSCERWVKIVGGGDFRRPV